MDRNDFGEKPAATTGMLQGLRPIQRLAERAARGAGRSQRLLGSAAVLLLAMALAGAGLSYLAARNSDDRLAIEQREALRDAVARLPVVSLDALDGPVLGVLERAADVRGLAIEAAPSQSKGRHSLSVLVDGRIVGWLSWQAERPAMNALTVIHPLIVATALLLVAFVVLVLIQMARLKGRLTNSESGKRKLLEEDPLTGLPHHRQIAALTETAIASRPADCVTVFAIFDIDDLDDVNGMLGHAGGDQVLMEFAQRLRAAAPAGASFGRLGADEFALILTARSAQQGWKLVQGVRLALTRPYWVEQAIEVSVGLGLAVAPEHGDDPDELMRHADLALRAAKKRGRGQAGSFDVAMEAEDRKRRLIRRDLARALSRQQIDVHYQPIVAAEGGAIIGVEALSRWDHPSRGLVSPAEFIPIAEEAGLMNEFGAFVLRRALAQAARWPDVYMAVNLSPVQVRDRGLVELVAAALAESGVAPSRLVLEMTEGVLIDNPDETRRRLQDLRALGVRLAIDDFGSGYSSLSYLQRLPFDKLKIDRGFIAALGRPGNGGVIVQAIITLGRALGLSVLVEGVETEEQRVLLRLAGCNEMQGYLFGRPAPATEVDKQLAGSGRRRILPAA